MGSAIAQLFSAPLSSTPTVDYLRRDLRDFKSVLAAHGGRMGRKILRGRNYFCIFYSFELKLYRMVELCIPKNPMFFVFRF